MRIARSVVVATGEEVEFSLDGFASGEGARRFAFPPTAVIPMSRVLVVDDNRDVCESLVIVLELLGHTGLAIDSGARALDVLKEADGTDQAFALAIVDIAMPGMSGYELVAAMRRHPAGEKLPIVALTGWVSSEDQARARQAGFDAHLAKPIELPELRELLQRVESRAFSEGHAQRGDPS